MELLVDMAKAVHVRKSRSSSLARSVDADVVCCVCDVCLFALSGDGLVLMGKDALYSSALTEMSNNQYEYLELGNV